jgi:hypothetical protein
LPPKSPSSSPTATTPTPATAVATITTPHDVSIPGFPDAHLAATLAFSTDFPKNGSLQKITVVAP